MRRSLAVAVVLMCFGGALVSLGIPDALAADPDIAIIDIDDAISPSTSRFLSRAIDSAVDSDAAILLVRLNTPGGLLDATRDMVDAITNAQVPVVVYVAPTGAHAASAGTFITAAAHVAAMAPITNIGAATPIAVGDELPETLARKVAQDAAALLRSIAEARGRNADALEATVLEARAYNATEALELGIVDLIAEDVGDLLRQLDGRSVIMGDGSEVSLQTVGSGVRRIRQTPLERVLAFLADPNIAFTLVSFGFIAIFVEWVLPGLWGPGIIGVIALALGFVALGNLPVNWVGVGLMAFAMGLFYLEMQAPGIGIFGVSGVIAFIIGGFLLFGGFTPALPSAPGAPDIRVSPFLLAGIAAAMAALLGFVIRDLAVARRIAGRGDVTHEPIEGQIGTVTAELSPQGSVHVAGEVWSAVSDDGEPIEKGVSVIVAETEGLTLRVFRETEVGD
jgi:membrane-bound serine protease (ClpP class)